MDAPINTANPQPHITSTTLNPIHTDITQAKHDIQVWNFSIISYSYQIPSYDKHSFALLADI
jgi:hypothetical protein